MGRTHVGTDLMDSSARHLEGAAGKPWLNQLLLIALLVLVRGWTFLSMTDVYYVGEEMARGSAAKAMLDSLPIAHHHIGHWYYEGGAFTVSHLTAVSFLLFGPSLLAHKLVALMFSIGMLMLGYRLVRRNFGGASATMFGLLFIFAPLGYQKLSLLNIGTHFGALLLLLPVLHFGMRVLFEREAPRWTLAVLGLSAGYAVYFNYQCLPAVAYVGGTIAIVRWRRLLGWDLALALGCFTIGLLPFLTMWSLVGKEIFNVHGIYLFGGSQASTTSQGGGPQAFLTSAFEQMDWPAVAATSLYLVLPIVGAAVFLLRHRVLPRELVLRYAFLAGYVAFFAIVYANSSFTVGAYAHYFSLVRFSPFWLVGLVLVTGFLGWLVSQPGPLARATGMALFSFLLLTGVLATGRALAGGRPFELRANWEIAATTRGYSYVEYLPYLANHLEGTFVDKMRVAMAFDEEDPEALYPEIAQVFLKRGQMSQDRHTELFDALDSDHREQFLLGMGPYFRPGRDLKAAARSVRESPIPEKDILFNALGRWVTQNYPFPETLRAELESFQLLDLPPSFFTGYGHRIYQGYRLDPAGGLAFIAAQEAPTRELLRAGFERARELQRVN